MKNTHINCHGQEHYEAKDPIEQENEIQHSDTNVNEYRNDIEEDIRQ